MYRNGFYHQALKLLSEAFDDITAADTQCVMSYLAKIPDPLANQLLIDAIKNLSQYSSRSLQDFKQHLKVNSDLAKTDLKWMQRLIKPLPSTAAQTLKNEYIRRRIKYQKGRSANIWLRKRVQFISEVCRSIPIPLHQLDSEKRRLKLADEWSRRCLVMLNRVTEQQSQLIDVVRIIQAVKQPADNWGFSPMLPDLDELHNKQKQGQDISSYFEVIAKAISRLIDSKWWQHQIENRYKQYKEHSAIIVGKVRANVSPYVSRYCLQDYQSRKKGNALWMKLMALINRQYELELPLIEAVKTSISNPHNRRVELMVRMRGFEEIAKEQGYVGEFYTWTAPSKYHSWCKDKKGKTHANAAYQGATPHETQQYLCKQWSKVRAKLERMHIHTFGFRVVEPHHDGTPHWHLLLFFKPDEMITARTIICEYAVQHDKEELQITTDFEVDECSPRFDYKKIDPAKGSATGYIAKYIAKNIDGAYVEEDFEAGCSGNQAAESVAAWASIWHIRQFQQIGGAPVTVWRELRRIKHSINNDEVLETARKAADSADWQGYIAANGGIICERRQRPVKLAKTVEKSSSRYGEDVSKIFGVIATCSVQSRLEGWELHQYQTESQIHINTPSSPNMVFHVSSDSCVPWRTDNNCTHQPQAILYSSIGNVHQSQIEQFQPKFLSG